MIKRNPRPTHPGEMLLKEFLEPMDKSTEDNTVTVAEDVAETEMDQATSTTMILSAALQGPAQGSLKDLFTVCRIMAGNPSDGPITVDRSTLIATRYE